MSDNKKWDAYIKRDDAIKAALQAYHDKGDTLGAIEIAAAIEAIPAEKVVSKPNINLALEERYAQGRQDMAKMLIRKFQSIIDVSERQGKFKRSKIMFYLQQLKAKYVEGEK